MHSLSILLELLLMFMNPMAMTFVLCDDVVVRISHLKLSKLLLMKGCTIIHPRLLTQIRLYQWI